MSDINIQKAPKPEDRSLPIFEEFDKLADRIREHAFSLFDGRGGEPGHAMEDWLKAEQKICWPKAELSENDNEYLLDVRLAGFESDDIEVLATPAELNIKAKKSSESKKSDEKEGANCLWSEFKCEDAYKHVDLPEAINVDKVTAEFKDGFLKIKAPKSKERVKKERKVAISKAA